MKRLLSVSPLLALEQTKPSRLPALLLFPLALALVSTSAAAGGRTISAEPVDDVKIRIDGDLREWPNKMTDLGETLEGKPSGGDPRVAATMAGHGPVGSLAPRGTTEVRRG